MIADKVLLSNAIYPCDGSALFSGGVAVKENKIIAVGPREIVNKYIGPDTEIREYGDKMILPGFCDAHVHFAFGAFFNSKYFINEIQNSCSEEDAVAMVKAFADAHPEYERIIGQGWFPANWNDAPLPTKESLDKVVPDRPVYLSAADAHTGWLNSCALEEVQVDGNDPVLGPNIGKFPNGELTGVLGEDAWFTYAAKYVVQPGPDIDEEVELDLLDGLAKSGITMVTDMSGILQGVNYDAMERIEKSGKLTARINLNPAIEDDVNQTNVLALKERFHSDKLAVTGVKGVIDGVTSTFTGYLLEPYSDKPETSGCALNTREFFENAIIAANKNGLGVHLHCIADGSVRLALDCYEKSNSVNNGNINVRNNVEHIENIHPEDIPRFKELGVIASMQPRHLPLDANEKISRMGEERCRWEWPHRSILDAGGILAFGTDYPVVDYNPFESIYYAITRNGYDRKPTGVNYDEEKISLEETLRAYTWGGAYACNRDHELGTITTGKLADLIVLDRDLFKIDTEEIPKTQVVLTMMDGNIIYDKMV